MSDLSIPEGMSGILLDLGCGTNKIAPHWVGLDKRKVKGVDIVHDIETFPYPLPDESVLTCVCSHTLEHIKPWLTLDVFNEVWRIMKPGGKFVINVPVAGSPGYWQDPTHCNGFTLDTFIYFDPFPSRLGWKEGPEGITQKGEPNLWYGTYLPKPWKILYETYEENSNIEVVLAKRPRDIDRPEVPEPARKDVSHELL